MFTRKPKQGGRKDVGPLAEGLIPQPGKRLNSVLVPFVTSQSANLHKDILAYTFWKVKRAKEVKGLFMFLFTGSLEM